MNRVQTIKGLSALVAALLSLQVNAQVSTTATASAGVSTYSQIALPSSFSSTNTGTTLAQISSASPDASSSIFGYAGTASADFQTLRAETSGSSPSPKFGSASVTTSFTSGVMTVSGISGSQVQFNIGLNFDGVAKAGFGDVVGSATAGADLKYQIFDLDSSAYIHDNMPLFQFDLSAKAEAYKNDANSPVVTWSRSFGNSVLGSNSPVSWGGGSNDYLTSFDYPNLAANSSVTLDTGVLSFSTSVLAGHRLVAMGTLTSFVSGSGSWVSSSKFGNTFDAELNVITKGASLQGYTPGVYATLAVPEPETYAMMLAGLGLMGAMTRRRHAKQTA